MSKFWLVTVCLLMGIVGCSLFWMMVLHEHEMSHRNFEYAQCEQFWELVEIHVERDYDRFDCNLILEHGVINFKIGGGSSLERNQNKAYAYEKEVLEHKRDAILGVKE